MSCKSAFKTIEETAVKFTLQKELDELDAPPDANTIAKIVGDMTTEAVLMAAKRDKRSLLDFEFMGVHVRLDEVNGHWALSVTYSF